MNLKESILIIVIPISLILIYYAMNTIQDLFKRGLISSRTKFRLSYLSIFIPVIGFLIVCFMNQKLQRQQREG